MHFVNTLKKIVKSLCVLKDEYCGCLVKANKNCLSQDEDEYVCMMALPAASTDLKIKEIERVSAEESELQAARKCLVDENWNSAPKQFPPVPNDVNVH